MYTNLLPRFSIASLAFVLGGCAEFGASAGDTGCQNGNDMWTDTAGEPRCDEQPGGTDGEDTDPPTSDSTYGASSAAVAEARAQGASLKDPNGWFCIAKGKLRDSNVSNAVFGTTHEGGFQELYKTLDFSQHGDVGCVQFEERSSPPYRWGVATVGANNEPALWADPSVTGTEGFYYSIDECNLTTGEIETKVNWCAIVTDEGFGEADCDGTYHPPEECADLEGDADTDTDTDSDTDADSDTDTDTDTDSDSDSCSIRLTADGDASIEGYSTYYAELYALPLTSSGGVISFAYWPSSDWSTTTSSSLAEALNFSSGGTGSATLTFEGVTSIGSVKLNGGVWTSSSSSATFIRWLAGNYSDSVGASLTAEKSCGGSSWTSMSCTASGNDRLCQ